MAVLARLWEEGKVDLDQTVTHYLPTWPQKMVNGQPVDITLRQLCSHLGGIRYEMNVDSENQTVAHYLPKLVSAVDPK
jgi:serine beta-lactamase-like protein LACTB